MKRKLIAIALITVLISVIFLGNSACTEVYEYPKYYLAIGESGGGDVIEPTENRAHAEGSWVMLWAEPDPDYEFVYWYCYDDDARCNIVEPCAAVTGIWMNGDYFIRPIFRPSRLEPPSCNGGTCYAIIGSTEGGSVTEPGEGGYVYECGQVVDLTAVAEPGYEFVSWYHGDINRYVDPCASHTRWTVCGNHCISAVFRPKDCPYVERYVLSIYSTEGGDVTEPGEGRFTYAAGAVVKLVATPDINYVFDEWTGDVSLLGLIDNEYYILIFEDCSIIANFESQLL